MTYSLVLYYSSEVIIIIFYLTVKANLVVCEIEGILLDLPCVLICTVRYFLKYGTCMLRWLKAISDHVFVITSASCPSPVEVEAGSASPIDPFLTVMG